MGKGKPTVYAPMIDKIDVIRSMGVKRPFEYINGRSYGRAPLKRGDEIIVLKSAEDGGMSALSFATVIGTVRKEPYDMVRVDWLGKEMDIFDFQVVAVVLPLDRA